MKRLFLALFVMWFLMVSMPIKMWNEIPNKQEYIKEMANIFAEENYCKSVAVAIAIDERIFILGRCKEKGEVDL